MHKELSEYDQTALFVQIRNGDTTAFRTIFDVYKERLFSFAYGLTHSKSDAEEIVQDVFMKLWENRSTLDKIEQPGSYVYRMVRNRSLDLLAKAGRDQALIQQVWANMKGSEELSEEILLAKESQELIEAAVALLPEKKQRIFQLSRRHALSHDEIAGMLGISKQTVKNNLSEALRHIRLYLEQRSALLGLLFWLHYFPLLMQEF
jgi:RNA polymerase sigma-70 factor (family 1)